MKRKQRTKPAFVYRLRSGHRVTWQNGPRIDKRGRVHATGTVERPDGGAVLAGTIVRLVLCLETYEVRTVLGRCGDDGAISVQETIEEKGKLRPGWLAPHQWTLHVDII